MNDNLSHISYIEKTPPKKLFVKINFPIFLISFLFIACSFLMFNCSGSQYKYPSISQTETKQYNYGHVVWRDLVTPDPKRAAEFYSKVFGWQVENYSKDDNQYWVFKNNGKPVAGMFQMSSARKGESGEWVGSISVPSVKTSADFITSKGGNIIMQPFEMNGRGTVALVRDPQESVFALIHSSKGDPVLSEAKDNEWLWSENWSNNQEGSANFYKTLLNAQTEDKKDDKRDYIIILNNGSKTEGIIKNPVKNVRSHWMQYIRVSDVNKITKLAKDAGATILLEPDPDVRKGTVAIIIDPSGAPFAIQKWPID